MIYAVQWFRRKARKGYNTQEHENKSNILTFKSDQKFSKLYFLSFQFWLCQRKTKSSGKHNTVCQLHNGADIAQQHVYVVIQLNFNTDNWTQDQILLLF